MFTNQNNNNVARDLIAGDKYEASTSLTIVNAPRENDELVSLYTKLKVDGVGDLSGNQFCEKLQHYLSARTEGDVRGLEEKLKDSDRLDQLDFALRQKESAAKAIMKRQTSLTAQRIFTIVLDELHTSYFLTVTPLIQAGGNRREIDQLILQTLQSAHGMLGENVLELTVKDLLGLLFFLGGNCHIRWDKC